MFLFLFISCSDMEETQKTKCTSQIHITYLLMIKILVLGFKKSTKNLNNRLKITNVIMIPLFYQPIKMLTAIFKENRI